MYLIMTHQLRAWSLILCCTELGMEYNSQENMVPQPCTKYHLNKYLGSIIFVLSTTIWKS